MQRPMPPNNSHNLPSSPTCSICREGRVRGAVLALCTKCHNYSHLQCREILPNPTSTLARCPDCTVAYRLASQTSNVPVPQPAFPPQPPRQSQPRSQQQQQYQAFTTNFPANIRPQYTSLPLLNPPYLPFPAVNAPLTTNGVVNPAFLNMDPTLHTQAGQTGFEIRRLARVMQTTTAGQLGIIQIVQPPPPPVAYPMGLTNSPLSRPLCRHPPGVSCDLCMPFGWPR